jgi:hypothetical protein
MSAYASKKRQSLIKPHCFLLYTAIAAILLSIGFVAGIPDTSFNDSSGSKSHASINASVNANPSFASDERYWRVNCSHGWTGNSNCDQIVLRTKSCAFSSASGYCSSYENYLRQYQKSSE